MHSKVLQTEVCKWQLRDENTMHWPDKPGWAWAELKVVALERCMNCKVLMKIVVLCMIKECYGNLFCLLCSCEHNHLA